MKKQEYVKLEGNDIEELDAAEARVLTHNLGRAKAEQIINTKYPNSLAEELGINENEKIKIVSPNGVINYFIVKFSRTVKKDHLFAPMHYVEVNSVLPSIFDKYSKEPSFKYVPVNIETVY